MNFFTVCTIIVAFSALFSYYNARYIKLPGTIGVLSIAVIVALGVLIFGNSFPIVAQKINEVNTSIDFPETLLDILLAFLLFAGAIHFDTEKLRAQLRPILILSTVGIILSTFIIGGLLYGTSLMFDIQFPFLYCLLFGALISPTDPVAVSSVLKTSRIPPRLETIISGESLFNDGIGLVLFITVLNLTENSADAFSFQDTLILFAHEVLGGIALGLGLGFIAYSFMNRISDFNTMMMISLAMVMGLSVIGQLIEVSIPLAAVCAGLFMGRRKLASDTDGKMTFYIQKLWGLLDELLNIVLFVLIGLQLVALPFISDYILLGIFAIIIALAARLLSIALPVIFLQRTLKVPYSSIFILTWGGIRGGISVALALSLPDSDYKPLILACGFIVVIFSIIGQGLSLNKLIDKLVN